MSELADIFRQFGPAYRDKYSEHMLPSHLAVMRAIEACRTEALGGQVYHCATCDETWYRYHCAKIVIAPSASNKRARFGWKQDQSLLLPVPYFLVTFTLPSRCGPGAAQAGVGVQPVLSSLGRGFAGTGRRPTLVVDRLVAWVCCRRGRAICAIIRTSTTWCQAVDWPPMGNAGWHRIRSSCTGRTAGTSVSGQAASRATQGRPA